MSYGNTVYIKNGSNILEASFLEMTNKIIVTTKTVARTQENSSVVYDGVVIQDILGSHFASVFPEPGVHYQIPLENLKGYKIVEAKFDHRVLCVIGVKKGIYSKFLYMFRDNFSKHNFREINDIAISDINFVCLENGICARINESENLELFHINSPDVKEIKSNSVSSDLRLCKNSLKVLGHNGKFLYQIKTK